MSRQVVAFLAGHRDQSALAVDNTFEPSVAASRALEMESMLL
jgi:hypothetical protein